MSVHNLERERGKKKNQSCFFCLVAVSALHHDVLCWHQGGLCVANILTLSSSLPSDATQAAYGSVTQASRNLQRWIIFKKAPGGILLIYLDFIWRYIQFRCIKWQNSNDLDLSLVICKMYTIFLSCFVNFQKFILEPSRKNTSLQFQT